MATGDIEPLVWALEQTYKRPANAQWVQFLRSHDELDLGRLDEEQREKVFKAFAPKKTMQLYNRGIRRRLTPMLGNSRPRLELAYSLLFSLPGTPMMQYGDEIGIGDNLRLPERECARTPMQWTSEEHAGFSPPGTRELVRPLCGDYETVNVADQRRDRGSLLNWMERLIRRRRECPEIGWGRPSHVPCEPGVFAHRCDWRGATVVATHNLTDQPICTRLRFDDLAAGDQLLDLLGDADAKSAESPDVEFELPPYGYRWLRIRRAKQRVLP